MVAYVHPFRIVNAASSPTWAVSIEQVNQTNWDYAALHEMVGALDVGLQPPYHMIVCRDGALGLPVVPQIHDDRDAVEFFNRCLAALLIGGVYCEAIALDGLDLGSIIDWRFMRVAGSGTSAPNRFHHLVRLQRASPFEAAALMNPPQIDFDNLAIAMAKGRSVLDAIPELMGEFLLKGTTALAKRDWSTALANLWIVVEQITSNLWTRDVVQPAKQNATFEGRVDQLADTRTWTTAARHELLHQIGTIPSKTLALLSNARKGRNELSHKGKHPNETQAHAAYDGAVALMNIGAPNRPAMLSEIDLQGEALSNPFEPKRRGRVQPKYWMAIPKLPGEAELEVLEADSYREYRRQQGRVGDEQSNADK